MEWAAIWKCGSQLLETLFLVKIYLLKLEHVRRSLRIAKVGYSTNKNRSGPMGKKKKQSKSSRKTKQQSTRKTATKLSTERPNSAANFSDDQIESFLKTGEHQGLLEAYFGEELYREFQELSRNTRSASRRGGQRVLILPGILGSKLGTKG